MRLFDKFKKRPAVDLQAHEVRVGPHTITPPDGWGMREDEEREGVLFYRLVEGVPEGQEPAIMLWRLPEEVPSPDEMLKNFWSQAEPGAWISKGTVLLREGLTAERYHVQADSDRGDAMLATLAVIRVSSSENLMLFAVTPRDQWDLVEKAFETALGSLILHDNGVPVTEEERRIKVTRLLERERRSYLRAFQYVKRTQVDEVEGADGIGEPLFTIVADLPEAYALCRPDILVRESGEWQTLFVSKDPLSGFEPVRFETASGMALTDVLSASGAERLEVSSGEPGSEYLEQWEDLRPA